MASSESLTYADLARFPDGGWRRELIAGELVVSAPPVTLHPDADRFEVYRLAGDRHTKPEIYEPGETLPYAPLLNFHLDLAQILAR